MTGHIQLVVIAQVVGLFLLTAVAVPAQSRRSADVETPGRAPRWAVILADDPVTERVAVRAEMQSAYAAAARRQVELAQQELTQRLTVRGVRRIGAVQNLLNAVFIGASDEVAAEIRTWPGVVDVVRMRAYRRKMNRVLDLVNARQGWTVIGGQSSAGLGTRIAILDTGIDQTHPGLQDASLPTVAGGPFCRGSDCDYTSRKVIAARSYVESLAYQFPDDTRPDDYTPRDRVGHGTALAMVAAGLSASSSVGEINGIAPKAYLGSYKIFGSPGVNDLTFTDVLIMAMDDALLDRMDVAVLALGFPADWGPNDEGATCDRPAGSPCDPFARAVRNAINKGLTVVVSAGNEGDAGATIPALNSITTPGTVPEAITVGGTTNSHLIFQSLRVTGTGVPARLQQVNTRFGNGPIPAGPLTRPARDVAALNNNGQACTPLASESLRGAFAVVQAGGCTLRTKVTIAQTAGADGVIFMRAEGSEAVFAATGLLYTGIPLVVIGNTDGKALREFLGANPDRPVTLDPTLREENDAQKYADFTAVFTSYGPSIAVNGIKPELVAPSTDVVTATQAYDPNGDMWSASRYTAINGTSFSAAIAAGAAALVKQRNPSWSSAEIKSALVNTASNKIDDFDNTGKIIPAGVKAIGAGKLVLDASLRTNVTVSPATVSFGAISRNATTLPSQGLTFRNHSNQSLTLRLTVQPREADANARVIVSSSSFTLQAGATSQPVTVRLEGRAPNPGSYEGYIQVEGGAVPLQIPFLYMVSDGVPANVLPLRNFDFDGIAEQRLGGGFVFKVVDKFGLGVPNLTVRWRVVVGGADVSQIQATRTTDDLGIAEASRVILGPAIGLQVFEAVIDQVSEPLSFQGLARLRPSIQSSRGIVNGASFEPGKPVAPGSWVTIQGQALADAPLSFTTLNTPYIPLSLGNVSVGVDVPGASRRSYPARLSYVSDRQINIQLPWELQGLTSADLKVSIGNYSSALNRFAIADYAPAPFQYLDSSGQLMIVATQANSRNVIGSSLPAEKGTYLTIYANGLGPVTNTPPTGEAAKADPLSRCRGDASVTFGGRPGMVSFCGLTPGAAGLHQIDVQVPADAPSGIQDVVITVNGISSTAVKTAIR